ncbi:arsenite efflux transporter ArsB-like, putative [Glarea lozoyensis ATCC 20868]|uniref:Arsenite efflux transporter ArsB-like, putative n=1 Tax=Glarea lozoyensis (strain ATCC 20868 / MF5171) TaxID=1116229 RepID=S3CW76_GLAL2|nr:arsenite efflux transporter ArsB-like, putative [Glarea lozoyensis ATCC 20868]EPE29870.1 arsenite efflux transporter ArsB-like, putative [Glarea lozoyensis ATCC 20868]
MVEKEPIDLDTSKIKEWKSIVTLLVFIITNLIVLFPFHVPIYIPRKLSNAFLDTCSRLRIISPRQDPHHDHEDGQHEQLSSLVRLEFPMNFVTAPIIADLFLLAIIAIGRKEVHDGTIGANHISPIEIMAFFLTLAYIAISIDASGLIRYLAFKVLQKGGGVGHRLFFYLYAFFFLLGSFIGNDPIILSGTAFLAYMTRVSSNIVHPRAWIYTQFAIANIASAILVSSNPTNLVLAGAFNIKFINYTANMIVPVISTAIILFPFLLYIVFADESLIPFSIKMHELSAEAQAKAPVNPNIPNARGLAEEQEKSLANDEEGQLLSLEEIMNPFLDKGGAAFGAVLMAATLVTILAVNAASPGAGKERPVYEITLPAAFIMFVWDIGFGWHHRRETRKIAQDGRQEVEYARAEAAALKEMRDEEEEEAARLSSQQEKQESTISQSDSSNGTTDISNQNDKITIITDHTTPSDIELSTLPTTKPSLQDRIARHLAQNHSPAPATLTTLLSKTHRWSQETFPTCTAVVAHLPFALVPFAFAMFILVQALVTKGWVPVFAYGWDHWVSKTGTVGSIAGMGFLSVILCNFAGTNIGTTILLSRVIQSWEEIHKISGVPITDRTFWATVYAMAIGVNYGAFSTAFSASLAGLLWRDILARKHIRVRRLDFARVNLPIIAIAMVVGCVVLVGQVYVVRGDKGHVPIR